MRIKPVPVIILGVVTVAIIAGIGIFAIGNTSDKQQNSSATVSVSKKNLKDSNSTSTEPVKAATTVEIQWEDSAVPVGTSFKVTAIVTPQDTEHALVWSSGNKDVCTIDSEGVVTVRSAGNAAITATVGTVSDSVIIQGIDSVSAGSDRVFRYIREIHMYRPDKAMAVQMIIQMEIHQQVIHSQVYRQEAASRDSVQTEA